MFVYSGKWGSGWGGVQPKGGDFHGEHDAMVERPMPMQRNPAFLPFSGTPPRERMRDKHRDR